jgi:hypothetical protein
MLSVRAPGPTLWACLSGTWDGISRRLGNTEAVGSSNVLRRDASIRRGASVTSVRSQEKLKMRKFLAILLAAVGFFGPADLSLSSATASSSSAIPRDETCSANDANDIFWPPLPDPTPDSFGSIDEFAAKLGTTGTARPGSLALARASSRSCRGLSRAAHRDAATGYAEGDCANRYAQTLCPM